MPYKKHKDFIFFHVHQILNTFAVSSQIEDYVCNTLYFYNGHTLNIFKNLEEQKL